MKRLFIFILIIILFPYFGCKESPPHSTIDYDKAIADFMMAQDKDALVFGKTESELKQMFGDIREVKGSFSILVSKNLHPYKPPEDHLLLRLADQYIVFELKDNTVIKVHSVSG